MNKTMRRTWVAAAIVAAVLTCVPATVRAQAAKIDLSGTWTFDVQTDAGGGTPTVTLEQKGDKLTGHYSSQTFGEQDLTGTVTGQSVEIVINADVQGTSLTVTYRGTVESKDSMKGEVDLGGLGSGTWTGRRQ
jgi:hypothetical protein